MKKRNGEWLICAKCQGEGKSAAHLGAFSSEDMADDPDFREDYLAGVYDKPCQACEGSGKVWVDNEHIPYDAGNDEDYDEDGELRVCSCSQCQADRKAKRLADLRVQWAESGYPEGSFSAWSGE